jgi:hypothetical protein
LKVREDYGRMMFQPTNDQVNEIIREVFLGGFTKWDLDNLKEIW